MSLLTEREKETERDWGLKGHGFQQRDREKDCNLLCFSTVLSYILQTDSCSALGFLFHSELIHLDSGLLLDLSSLPVRILVHVPVCYPSISPSPSVSLSLKYSFLMHRTCFISHISSCFCWIFYLMPHCLSSTQSNKSFSLHLVFTYFSLHKRQSAFMTVLHNKL